MRCETTDAQFLPCLSGQRILYTAFESRSLIPLVIKTFLVVDMPTNGCVPLPWLDIFPYRSLLEEEVSSPVKDMKMYNGMQHPSSTVCLPTCYLP